MAPSRLYPTFSATGSHAGLSESQIDSFHDNGYLVLRDELDQQTVASLLQETYAMLDDFDLSTHPMTRFSTGQDGKAHVGDDYFLTSGDKIRFFFEEDAFDAAGNLAKPKERAINKIGHYLHALSPQFARISLSPRNAAIAASLKYTDPRCLQSMVICKQPEIGGAVPPHQDSTFLYTDPPSAVGFWYALEDATLSNGALSFARGSHRRTPVRKRFVRQKEGGTGFVDLAGQTAGRFPDGEGEEWVASGGDDDEEDDVEEEYTLEEVKAGTLVIIHGNVLHKSEKNLSGKSRFIYTFHLIEGKKKYDELNWLQPPQGGFSRLELESASTSGKKDELPMHR